MSSTLQSIDLGRARTPLARASPLIVVATDFTPAALAAARRAAELARAAGARLALFHAGHERVRSACA
jgi:hypothetical protein